MCSTDYDSPELYNQKMVKAKKLHSCIECGRTIKTGELYQYTFAKYYGEKKADIFKTCKYCVIPQQWLLKECNGYLHHGLTEEIAEHACEYRKIFLYKWLIGIRTKWIHMNSLWRHAND